MEFLIQLRKSSGKTQKDIAEYLGVSRQAYANYENGTRKPDFETLLKLGEYFNVSIDYLLRGKAETPALTKKDERDIAKTLEQLKETLEKEDGLMFDGDPMSDEAKDSILAAMELGLQAAKLKNKEKYTPKKYKKD